MKIVEFNDSYTYYRNKHHENLTEKEENLLPNIQGYQHKSLVYMLGKIAYVETNTIKLNKQLLNKSRSI